MQFPPLLPFIRCLQPGKLVSKFHPTRSKNGHRRGLKVIFDAIIKIQLQIYNYRAILWHQQMSPSYRSQTCSWMRQEWAAQLGGLDSDGEGGMRDNGARGSQKGGGKGDGWQKRPPRHSARFLAWSLFASLEKVLGIKCLYLKLP